VNDAEEVGYHVPCSMLATHGWVGGFIGMRGESNSCFHGSIWDSDLWGHVVGLSWFAFIWSVENLDALFPSNGGLVKSIIPYQNSHHR
jgi:hypothetical protein